MSKRHRRPRPKVSKRPIPSNSAKRKPAPTFDYDGTLDVLRDNAARADAMIVAADDLIVQLWSREGGGATASLDAATTSRTTWSRPGSRCVP